MIPVYDVIVVGGGPAGVASALKCSGQGYKTLLLEKGHPGRHKPCGGVTPTLCADILEEEFGLILPQDVMCSPDMLELLYVPPSGRANSGRRSNYRLLNLNRDRFDQWLCEIAEERGVHVLYGAKFQEFGGNGTVKVMVKYKDNIMDLRTRYLIGADGVSSKVRSQLYPDLEYKMLNVYQEYWHARGDFDNCFYVFLRESITPSYAYVIPKNGLFIIGTGAPVRYPLGSKQCLSRFKEWIGYEFSFEPLSLVRKEMGSIPYPLSAKGMGNVILAGDAAGFCNSFSGEGIRLAIESGIAAGDAIVKADQDNISLSSVYTRHIEGLNEFIHKTYSFSISLRDIQREQFVTTQVKPLSIRQ